MRTGPYPPLDERLEGRTSLDSPQRPEHQRLRSWAHHHPKPDAPIRKVVVSPVAIGGPHEPVEVIERPTSPHTRFVSIRLEIFTPRPLSETCWVWIIPPYATCPLPHVPDYVQQPIGTGPFGSWTGGLSVSSWMLGQVFQRYQRCLHDYRIRYQRYQHRRHGWAEVQVQWSRRSLEPWLS
jgi:hypothetical protein